MDTKSIQGQVEGDRSLVLWEAESEGPDRDRVRFGRNRLLCAAPAAHLGRIAVGNRVTKPGIT